jgi:hypothetical protein
MKTTTHALGTGKCQHVFTIIIVTMRGQERERQRGRVSSRISGQYVIGNRDRLGLCTFHS